MVFRKMQPPVGAATEGQARPHDLGDAVGRGALNLEPRLDLLAHRLGERRGHQQGALEAQFRRRQVHAGHHRQEVPGHGRRGHQDRGLVIPHHHEFFGEVQDGRRDHRGPQIFGPGLEVPAPVGQPRGQDYLYDVFPGHSRGRVHAGQELQPEFQVRRGIAHHQGLFRGAGRGQDADDVTERHREQAVGVVFRQVVPGGAGEPGQILEALDVIQVQPQLVELAAVELHLTVSPGEGALEALQLQQFQFPPVHGLNFRLAHVLLQ